jgi:hypothetical protein
MRCVSYVTKCCCFLSFAVQTQGARSGWTVNRAKGCLTAGVAVMSRVREATGIKIGGVKGHPMFRCGTLSICTRHIQAFNHLAQQKAKAIFRQQLTS